MLPPDRLPQPRGFGYLGDARIRATQTRLPQVADPEQIAYELSQYRPPKMPDVVRARYGAGDKQMVGSLLRAANGEDSGLTGVSPMQAVKILDSFGYPSSADAWTYDQWEQAITANAVQPNPLDVLGMY